MFLCQSVFCLAALLLTSGYAASSQDAKPIIKIPEQCKGRHLCTIKPEGYQYLEAKIDSWLPDYVLKDHIEKADPGLEDRIGQIESQDHNCREQLEQGLTFTYFYNDSNSRNYEILAQSERFQQRIKAVSCRKLKAPLADSSEQCFSHLGITKYNLKSSCEIIWAKRALFVLNKDRTGIIKKILSVPVACSCMVSTV